MGLPDRDPAEHRCTRCSATPGQPCRTPSGREAKHPHSERSRAVADVRPYTLRHSFASLLLHEGRSVIYVARQLGHSAQLTMSTYGHVIEELDDAPRISAEDAIRAARTSTHVRDSYDHSS